MGSPVSPPLANLVMEYIEDNVFSELKKRGITVKKYHRFMDDTFMIANRRHITEIVNEFNAQHPRLQFTFEKEQDGSLPFLDVKVMRQNDGTITTQWSGRYLSFDSQLPLSSKKNTISLLTRKVFELSD